MIGGNYPMIMALGEIQYLTEDGDLVKGMEASAVLVADADELEDLAGLVNPGTVAFTAGFASMWQLGKDGTWTEM